MKHLLTIFAVVILLSATNLFADVIYVKQGATGTGASWADAFGTLQEALDEAESGDEIWVAEGTYYPTYDYGLDIGDRGKHFRMKNGVAIYGGFPAIENPGMDDRDWATYETILSGDIGTPGDNTDNCYHVFYHPDGHGLDETALLNGFILTDGNADGGHPHYFGGGMYNSSSSPTISNSTFTSNSATTFGGGMFNESSSPTIINCSFTGNSAVIRGGGMYNYISSPTISNCSFTSNSVANWDGGGMYNHESSPTISNSTFSNNSAGDWGGGMANVSSSPTISNSTFTGNSAGDWGGGMYNSFSSPTISSSTFTSNSADAWGGGMYNGNNSSPSINNSIIWGNIASSQGKQFYIVSGTTTLNYSCYANGTNDVAGGGTFTATNNNITDDPLFVGSGDHPYSLQPTSPCINTGSNGLIPVGVTTDIIGNPRISFGTVDMGAYEAGVSINLNSIYDICYDSPVDLVAEIGDVTVVGGEGELTYSWSPSFLVEHTNLSSPVATLTRAIRDGVYTLTVTDANGMQGTAEVSVEVLAGNVITAPGTIVQRFRAEEITAPLNLFELALGDGYAVDYADYDLEFECRLGWLPPGEESCEGFDPTSYMPLPNSRLYGWIIIKHSEGCNADIRRLNIVVRGNEIDFDF